MAEARVGRRWGAWPAGGRSAGAGGGMAGGSGGGEGLLASSRPGPIGRPALPLPPACGWMTWIPSYSEQDAPLGHCGSASRGAAAWRPRARSRKGKAGTPTLARVQGLKLNGGAQGVKAGAGKRAPRQGPDRAWRVVGVQRQQRPGQGHGTNSLPPLPRSQAGSVCATSLQRPYPLSGRITDYPMGERCCPQHPRPTPQSYEMCTLNARHPWPKKWNKANARSLMYIPRI